MLKKNDCYPAQITGYTSEGLGVAHVDGQAVFVARAIAGEQGTIQILKATANRAYGKWASLELPSPHRREPDCPYFGRCGGCDFWHIDYAEETRLKADRVRDALTRIGRLGPGPAVHSGRAHLRGLPQQGPVSGGRRRGRAGGGLFPRPYPPAHPRLPLPDSV